MKVFVYWNIRKKCYSIRHKGKVIAHAKRVLIADAEFVVSEAGRQRVLDTGHKNVHAGVRGELVGADVTDLRWLVQYPGWSEVADVMASLLYDDGMRVRYNPKTGPHFVTVMGGMIVLKSNVVMGITNRATEQPLLYAKV